MNYELDKLFRWVLVEKRIEVMKEKDVRVGVDFIIWWRLREERILRKSCLFVLDIIEGFCGVRNKIFEIKWIFGVFIVSMEFFSSLIE